MVSPRLAFMLASLSLCSLGCPGEAARDETPATLELERRVAELEAVNEALTLERETLQGQLDACTKCRTMNIQAFDAFGQSSAYPEATNDTITDAIALLEARVAARERDEKLAIVLDIDETILSNYEQLDGSDYCYDKTKWNDWVETGKPKPITGAERLYAWAREHDVAIVFLTGRKQPQRAATERALREAGFGEWTELIVRDPSENDMKASEYKAGRRAKLESEGWTIILTLGDQLSDLEGGHSEKTLLMPNPFYQVL
ncbi:HAD family acid phosphatase [Nannocystaceae bacterium ST9]